MSMHAAKILAMLLLCLPATTASFDPGTSSGPPAAHDYSRRFAQVRRHCRSQLSSAGELSVGADRAGHLIRDLFFTDGDWSQDAGHAPLFPFHERSYADAAVAAAAAAGPELLHQAGTLAFVSFRVTQVQRIRAPPTTFNVSGVLTFTLACNSGCRPRASPEMELWHGVSKFHILFEGVYTETRPSTGGGGGGERVLCMVGSSAFPMRSADSAHWAENAGGKTIVIEPPSAAAAAAGNTLLVLRYPKVHALTTRAVRGEMTSLSAKSEDDDFDAVRLVSRLGTYSVYHLRPDDEKHVAAWCSSSSSQPSSSRGGGGGGGAGDVTEHLYRGASFCDILRKFTSDDYFLLPLVPNSSCSNSTGEFCGRPGPFDAGGGLATTAVAFARSAVTVQDLRCTPGCVRDGMAAARVSAVLRFVPPWEDPATAAARTSLGGATLSAEGAWFASSGRLFMAACLGAGDADACRHRVALRVPTAFSITRRGIVVGRITATDGSHPPLSFQQRVPAGQEWRRFGRSGEAIPMAYHYTKVKQAGELLRGSKPYGLRDNLVARSLLRYPKIAGADDDGLVSLSSLAHDLRLSFQCTAKLPFVPEWIEEPCLELQILSIDTLVGSYYPQFEDGSSMPVEEIHTAGHGVQKPQHVFNVSAELVEIRNHPGPVMSLEGVYNPADGRMHLIGCRDVVHAPWRDVSKSRDLEDGMDCSIEVTVEYPPTTMRWLINPPAKVLIASARDDDGDPLRFGTTELRSMRKFYDDGRNEPSEPTLEALLCIAVLSATIAAAAAAAQLRHVDAHPDVAPYVSLAMLGVQALGHGATVVAGARVLPAWPSYSYKLHVDTLECSVRALTLAALLLTAWLAQKVWRARAAARARAPLEPGRVPGDGAVLLCSLAVHLGGLFVAGGVHWLSTRGVTLTTPPPIRGSEEEMTMPSPSDMWSVGFAVERYVGVVKEWFLLPQVIGNALWRVNCKPLAARYYAGVTAAWLLPHVYGYIRPPGASVGVYSKAGAVVIPGVGVVLALLVFVQQRWNYRIVGWATRTPRNKLPKHVY